MGNRHRFSRGVPHPYTIHPDSLSPFLLRLPFSTLEGRDVFNLRRRRNPAWTLHDRSNVGLGGWIVYVDPGLFHRPLGSRNDLSGTRRTRYEEEFVSRVVRLDVLRKLVVRHLSLFSRRLLSADMVVKSDSFVDSLFLRRNVLESGLEVRKGRHFLVSGKPMAICQQPALLDEDYLDWTPLYGRGRLAYARVPQNFQPLRLTRK